MTAHSTHSDGEARFDLDQFLVCRLGADAIAIPLEAVVEVREREPLTPVPGAAHFVLGLTSRRGAVVAVIDLSDALGIDASHHDEETGGREVVLGVDGVDVALVADEVLGVSACEELLPPIDGLPQPLRPWCSGTLRTENTLALALSPAFVAGLKERAGTEAVA